MNGSVQCAPTWLDGWMDGWMDEENCWPMT